MRIHKSRDTTFLVAVTHPPIIEDCASLRFGPYAINFDGCDALLKVSDIPSQTPPPS
jgi:hypothetical protein